ncbi:phosphatase 2C-like domain-containing protein [Gorgonomyces haynaldii]|nr:phosphatase 2C-like domain-containing protein [Gorgonomyces haynaldii]
MTTTLHRILKGAERTFQFLKRIDMCTLGSNQPNQDTWTITQTGNRLLLGVFDGHYTKHTSHYLSQTVPQLPLLDAHSELLELDQKLIHALFDNPIAKMSLRDIKNIPIQKRSELMQLHQHALSGSCALVCILEDSNLQVHNLGDSRALLVHRGLCRQLSHDHQLSNPDELERVLAEHPKEPQAAYRPHPQSPLRVLGGLMPTRAFGDARFKWSIRQQAIVDALIDNLKIPSHSWLRPDCLYTPPYISSEPQSFYHDLQDEQYLILASDGLFDFLSNRQIAEEIKQWHKDDGGYDNLATYLVRQALGHEKRAMHLLHLDPRESRWHRDDMTVIVIHLQS